MCSINILVEFCLNEIALEGLDGCQLVNLFDLLYQSALKVSFGQDEHLVDNELIKLRDFFLNASQKIKQDPKTKKSYENYIWRIISNQIDLDFYLSNHNEPDEQQHQAAASSSSSSSSKKLAIVSTVGGGLNLRGFCKNFQQRKLITHEMSIRDRSLDDLVNTYGARLHVVANQLLRNRVLCPSYKNLNLECLNDIEYCILEAIGKKRYEGIYTTGDDGLSSLFSIVPKQLHYILNILESHSLIKKQSSISQKKRLIVHLVNYLKKSKSIVESIADYLFKKNNNSKNNAVAENTCCDKLSNIKRRFNLGNKQFKNLIQNAEKQSILIRYSEKKERKIKVNRKSVKKSCQIRMVRLTDQYYRELLASNGNATATDQMSLNDLSSIADGIDDDSMIAGGDLMDELVPNDDQIDSIGSGQSLTHPLYSQMFAKIEQYEKDGISLKRLGNIFALDFYRSRRMGSHLQSHPEVVTIIKETDRGKAKYQTVVLRKFLLDQQHSANSSASQSLNSSLVLAAASSSTPSKNSSTNHHQTSLLNTSAGSSLLNEVQIVKHVGCNDPSQTIQALMSNRTSARKQIIIDYISKARICTKYEINKEIKRIEAEQGLKGSIDSKTTKRMLLAMEKENKLKVFDLNFKNVCYMGVRLLTILDTDDEFTKYCNSFRRTFDIVDVKVKNNNDDEPKRGEDSNESSLNVSNSMSTTSGVNNNNNNNSCLYSESPIVNSEDEAMFSQSHQVKLTRNFIKNECSKYKFSNNFAKIYALVPKFQKAVILHRFLQYLLYFYSGKPQVNSEKSLKLIEKINKSNSTGVELADKCHLPDLENTYHELEEDSAKWYTYIPKFRREEVNSKENNCIFIGEIFSHMPLSIFSSIIVINHQVPGLIALLNHPHKRHMLVKDIPPGLIAPLIFERRYLQRILSNLYILAYFGLITFVESPYKTTNKGLQSLWIYVHKSAQFYDTSLNKCKNWDEWELNNKLNYDNLSSNVTSSSSSKANFVEFVKYDKYEFHFKADSNVLDYWKKLFYVSLNTFSFNVSRYLKEDKNLKQKTLSRLQEKVKLEEIADMKVMLPYSDRMGPGGYDSQLFLNSIKNWKLPSINVNESKNNLAHDFESIQVPFSELIIECHGVSKRILTTNNNNSNSLREEKKLENEQQTVAKKSVAESSLDDTNSKTTQLDNDNEDGEDEDEDEDDDENENEDEIETKTKTRSTSKSSKLSVLSVSSSKRKNFKQAKAQSILSKAKRKQISSLTSKNQSAVSLEPSKNESRATWSWTEDELILLVKVASLYFFPKEKSLSFKLLHGVVTELNEESKDKKISSFGRRIKGLMKSKMNQMFVINKLELCKQDLECEKMFAKKSAKLDRNLTDQVQIDTYIQFVKYAKEKYLKRVNYYNHESTTTNAKSLLVDSTTTAAPEKELILGNNLEEFHKKFKIKNSHLDIINENSYQQPKDDYEIKYHTLHNAIQSTISINDKNPRVEETTQLFNKYDKSLFAEVITRMSRDHKIIAATKSCDLKNKTINALSKYMNKNYHVAQRYQIKWMNNISTSLINDTNHFKEVFLESELAKKRTLSANSSSNVNKRLKLNLQQQQQLQQQSTNEMYDCSDNDNLELTSFLAHTLDNPSLNVLIDVPDKIYESDIIGKY